MIAILALRPLFLGKLDNIYFHVAFIGVSWAWDHNTHRF